MTDPLRQYIEEVRSRLEAATPGPWTLIGHEVRVPTSPDGGIVTYEDCNENVYRDCDDPECDCMDTVYKEALGVLGLIESAPTDIRNLLEIVEVAVEALEDLFPGEPCEFWMADYDERTCNEAMAGKPNPSTGKGDPPQERCPRCKSEIALDKITQIIDGGGKE